MKAPFQKDEALLADIAKARAEQRHRIWWLGQSGFLLATRDATILFDPYLSDSLTRKYAETDKPHVRLTERVIAPERLTGIDVVTSSHGHTDHLDAETLIPLLEVNPQAKLIIPRANRDLVQERLGSVGSSVLTLNAGEHITLGPVALHGITAAHNRVERDEQGCCRFMGYVAELSGRTVYHSGDTLLHDGLVDSLQAFHVNLALLPINGNRPERRVAGNLNGQEAAGLAHSIRARVVVPHHFDLFDFNTASPDPFETECRRRGQRFRTLQNGEGLDL